MRMWMVDPQVMCNQHLLGEHVELHMVVGALTKGYAASVVGLIRADLLELDQLGPRHEALVAEMVARGMNHQSVLTVPEEVDQLDRYGVVDVAESYREMARRCADCRDRQALRV